MAVSYKEFQAVAVSSSQLPGLSVSYRLSDRHLQAVTDCNRQLHGVPHSYLKLQTVTDGYINLQAVTGGYRQ